MSQEQSPQGRGAPGHAQAGARGGSFGGGTAALGAIQVGWAGLGQPERVAIVAATVAGVAYLLGILADGWSLAVPALALIVGSLVVIAAVFLRGSDRTVPSGPVTLAIRGGAAVAGAFALVDLGDLLASVGDVGTFSLAELILWPAYVIAGLVLVWAAWRVTGGDVLAAARGLLAPAQPLARRLVLAGAVGAAVGWAVMLFAGSINMLDDSDVAVLSAVLAAVALWGGATGALRSGSVPAAYVVGLFAAVTTIFALAWLFRILPDILKAGPLGLLGIVVYVVAVAGLATGAGIGVSDELRASSD